MKKIYKYLLFILFSLSFFYVISNIGTGNSTYNEIRQERIGVIISIDSLRSAKDHYTLRDINNNTEQFPNGMPIVKQFKEVIEVGDSLIKNKNDVYCIVIKKNGTKLKVRYTSIPYQMRLNENFPKKWRCKWLEASKWDSLSIYKNKVFEVCNTD